MTTKKMSLLALFIALSIIGSMIKIPAIIGSVALDVFPALFAAVLIGRRSGAFVAGMGHLVSAMIAGMPLGPMHVLVAVEMMIIVWVFSYIYESGRKMLSAFVFIVMNSLLAPLPFAFILSLAFYVSIIPSLIIGSLVNIVLALVFIPRFETLFATKLAGIIR